MTCSSCGLPGRPAWDLRGRPLCAECRWELRAARLAGATLARELRATSTPSLTTRERNRAVRSHVRHYAHARRLAR